jgi:hypothetical protein
MHFINNPYDELTQGVLPSVNQVHRQFLDGPITQATGMDMSQGLYQIHLLLKNAVRLLWAITVINGLILLFRVIQ